MVSDRRGNTNGCRRCATSPRFLVDLASLTTDRKTTYERLAYYEHAGPDFGEWSTAFNMHFGSGSS